MGLALTVENLDGVDEKYHDLYEDKGDNFVLTGVDGMKTQADIERIKTGLTKERDAHSATKNKLSVWGELDAEEVQAKLDRFEELEQAAEGKLDDEAIEKIVETRIKSKTSPLERSLAKLQKEKDELAATNEALVRKDELRKIKEAVRAAAVDSGLRDTAYVDAEDLSERVFEIDDSGAVVVKDQVGYTPGVDAVTWLTEVQPKRPHWWGESSGGGSSSKTKVGGANNPFSKDNWNLTEQGRLITSDRTKAENMAKAAGTIIGGPRPV